VRGRRREGEGKRERETEREEVLLVCFGSTQVHKRERVSMGPFADPLPENTPEVSNLGQSWGMMFHSYKKTLSKSRSLKLEFSS
jgi:hypothetical protein